MSLMTIAALFLAMLVLAVTPGPGVFSVVARSLSTGFYSTFGMIAGIVTGDAVFLMFSVFGLSFVAKSMGEFFIIIKYCGGLYLIWMGLKIIFSREKKEEEKKLAKGGYLSGLLITLSNPKVILFYCGFLPSFMDLNSLNKTDIFIATFIITSVLSSVLLFYAYLADSAKKFIKSRRSVKMLNRFAGTVMIGSGVAIATRS